MEIGDFFTLSYLNNVYLRPKKYNPKIFAKMVRFVDLVVSQHHVSPL
jgi:hypothetical protein